jgi:hypothetical protein
MFLMFYSLCTPHFTYICFQNVLFRAPSRNEIERFARRCTGVNERDKLWEMKRNVTGVCVRLVRKENENVIKICIFSQHVFSKY